MEKLSKMGGYAQYLGAAPRTMSSIGVG